MVIFSLPYSLGRLISGKPVPKVPTIRSPRESEQHLASFPHLTLKQISDSPPLPSSQNQTGSGEKKKKKNISPESNRVPDAPSLGLIFRERRQGGSFQTWALHGPKAALPAREAGSRQAPAQRSRFGRGETGVLRFSPRLRLIGHGKARASVKYGFRRHGDRVGLSATASSFLARPSRRDPCRNDSRRRTHTHKHTYIHTNTHIHTHRHTWAYRILSREKCTLFKACLLFSHAQYCAFQCPAQRRRTPTYAAR